MGKISPVYLWFLRLFGHFELFLTTTSTGRGCFQASFLDIFLRCFLGIFLALSIVACNHLPAAHKIKLEQKFITNTDGKTVETFFAYPPSPPPWPVLIVIHGHYEDSRGAQEITEKQAQLWNPEGVLVVGVSQPGYGNSQGPADFAGPRSQNAVEQTLDFLRGLKEVHSKKILIYGVSRGAAIAANVAARDSDLAAAVLVSGFYDLEPLLPKWHLSNQGQGILGNLSQEIQGTGTPKEISISRSALRQNPIRIPFLAIGGDLDPICDIQQAQRLVERSKKIGVPAQLIAVPDLGHKIPPSVRNPLMKDFITKHLLTNR